MCGRATPDLFDDDTCKCPCVGFLPISAHAVVGVGGSDEQEVDIGVLMFCASSQAPLPSGRPHALLLKDHAHRSGQQAVARQSGRTERQKGGASRSMVTVWPQKPRKQPGVAVSSRVSPRTCSRVRSPPSHSPWSADRPVPHRDQAAADRRHCVGPLAVGRAQASDLAMQSPSTEGAAPVPLQDRLRPRQHARAG